ncbi:MAG: hypothetical protein RL537_352 [Actinomycetota bacterium]|jgi:hypothetical protein
MRWFLLLPLLVGCSQSELAGLQQKLDQYADLSANSQSLHGVLSGAALESAEKSLELQSELGLTQIGLARFEVLSAANGLGSGCLDLSDLELVNSKGELIRTSRSERVEFEVEYEPNFVITSLEVSENPC